MLEAWPPHNLAQEFDFARLESCRSYSFRLERQVYGALLPDSPPDQRPLWPTHQRWVFPLGGRTGLIPAIETLTAGRRQSALAKRL